MKTECATKGLRRAAAVLALAAVVAGAGLMTAGCEDRAPLPAPGKMEAADSVALLVKRVSSCARLYTTSYRIHKLVTHDDRLTVRGRLFSQDFSFRPPVGERKVAIPVDVTLKAYIDFADFGPQNVERNGRDITLTLPDPQVVVTASRVDHAGTRQYVDLTRRRYSDAELADLARQGADSIAAHVDRFGIAETARRSATQTLLPILRSMGYAENRVTIRFRKDFSADDLNRSVTIENHAEQ